MDINQTYQNFVQKRHKIADLSYILAVLQWDMEVYMPTLGASKRGDQVGTLASMLHSKSMEVEYVSILTELNSELEHNPTLEEGIKVNIKEAYKDYVKDSKLDNEFVERHNKLISNSFHAWAEAKNKGDFSLFLPFLEDVINITKEKQERIGFSGTLYDALLDEYDPGLTTESLNGVFEVLKKELIPMIQVLKERNLGLKNPLEGQKFDTIKQFELCKEIAQILHFDFNAGRLDVSEHPFTTNFSSQDVRITTHFNPDNLIDSIWSTIHEVGHGLYELGLPSSEYGLATGQYCSLSIHESQSRFWENNVGKSKEFIEVIYPIFKKYFNDQLPDSQEEFYQFLNKVEPNLIRIQSDEITYHLHIIIRFEIEQALFDGSLKAKDIPMVWNQKVKDYLGLEVPNDSKGCLQDVHWSHGSFGYFPTYTMGTLYASQWQHYLEETSPFGLNVGQGNFKAILDWHRANIHSYGRRYSSGELCNKATGKALNPQYFIDYLKQKYSIK